MKKLSQKRCLANVIESINILENGIIKKIEIIDKNQTKLINSISKAISELTFKLENETL